MYKAYSPKRALKITPTVFNIAAVVFSALCFAALSFGVALPVTAQDAPQSAAPSARQAAPERIQSIRVLGNQRIEANTIASYLLIQPGDRYSEERIDLSVKTLFATGLFADVLIEPGDGNILIRVIENPIINRVIVEGNKALKKEKITDEIEAKPRAVFTRAKAQADVQRIIELYRVSGRFAADVTPKVVQQAQNRVDLIFEISEGPTTGVKRINFIGNNEYPDKRLRQELATEESRWYRFFSSNDNYDPSRMEYDREQLRTYYTDRGFADFRVVSAIAELTPDQEDFYITFTLDEGEEYVWGDIDVKTELETLDEKILRALVPIKSGEIYQASKVESAIEGLTFAAGATGYAFVDIQPRVTRNREDNTVDLTFEIKEGPRVYIERIDIVGNTTTLDYVIRREMELVEGDAFNRILLDRSKNRVRSLRFFEAKDGVEITEVQGSKPDRAIVQVKVVEQPTGELSFSAGFSSADQFLVDLSISQRNLRGRGQQLKFLIRGSANRQEIDLRFTEPRFLNRNLAGSVQVFDVTNDYLDESGFRSQRTGGLVSLGFPVTEYTALQARYALRVEEVTVPGIDCDDAAAAFSPQTASLCSQSQEGGRLTSSLGYTFSWDRRNDPIEPTRGFDMRVSQDFAGVGGDAKYLKTELTANTYYGIFKNVIASGKFSGGYIQGFGNDPVQINDRFFKGSNSFRGFDNSGLGPRVIVQDDDTGEVLTRGNAMGGNLYAIGAAEVSFPLGLPEQYGILGSLFFEAGTVGLLDEQFVISDTALYDGITSIDPDSTSTTLVVDDLSLRAVIGASVFWESPFGPIRFDFAHPLANEEYDRTKSFQFNTRTRF